MRDLTSCDFVGELGCADPTCWQCHSPIGPGHLRCLSRNLATAALLCIGWQRQHKDTGWRPGCGVALIGGGT